MGFKEFFKFAGSLRGVWDMLKGIALTSSPLKMMNFLEQRAGEINPRYAEALGGSQKWQDLKRCNNAHQMQDMALAYAKEIPFFADKSKDEIMSYVKNTGVSLGFVGDGEL